MKYGGVIFDLDGVIVSTDDYHYRAWKRLSDEVGIWFDREINHRLRGVSRMGSLEIILEKSPVSYSEDEKKALAERKNKYYVALINELTRAAILPGAEEFVKSLRAKGIKVAIASSSKNAGVILQKTQMLPLFDAVVDGTDISHSKPHPEVFLKAAERIGLLPDECLAVEDAKAGVKSAVCAGMDTLAVGDAKGYHLAKYSLNGLDEIKSLGIF